MRTTPIATAETVTPALLTLLQAISPGTHTDSIRPALHALAVSVKAALEGGASPADLLEAVITATAPPPPPPLQPWQRYSGLTLDEFRTAGVALIVRIPTLDITLSLVGDEADRMPLSERERLGPQQVQTPAMVAQAFGLPLADFPTMGALVDALQGRVTGSLPTVRRT